MEHRGSPSDYKGWYLDPQGKDFGENAKFYKRNIAEAKKLMSAAGYTGQTIDSNEAAGTNYGPGYAPSDRDHPRHGRRGRVQVQANAVPGPAPGTPSTVTPAASSMASPSV